MLEYDRYDGAGWAAARRAEADESDRERAEVARLLAEADAAWLRWMDALKRRFGHAAGHRAGDHDLHRHPPECWAAWCAYCGARDRWQEASLRSAGAGCFAGVIAALTDPRRRPS